MLHLFCDLWETSKTWFWDDKLTKNSMFFTLSKMVQKWVKMDEKNIRPFSNMCCLNFASSPVSPILLSELSGKLRSLEKINYCIPGDCLNFMLQKIIILRFAFFFQNFFVLVFKRPENAVKRAWKETFWDHLPPPTSKKRKKEKHYKTNPAWCSYGIIFWNFFLFLVLQFFTTDSIEWSDCYRTTKRMGWFLPIVDVVRHKVQF